MNDDTPPVGAGSADADARAAAAELQRRLDRPAPAVPLRSLLLVLIAPVLAAAAFVLCDVSALHAPTPHDLALTVSGPSAEVDRVSAALATAAPGGFDVTRVDSAQEAVRAVRSRAAVGAIVLDPRSTTVVTASGGGKAAAAAVTTAGGDVAERLGTPVVTQDAAPTATEDSGGTTLFYLLLMGTMGGFLTMLVALGALGIVRRRVRILTAVVAAVVLPVLSLTVSSFFVGDLGMDLGHLAAVAGIDALYVLVVALLALVLQELLGRFSPIAGLVLIIALNVPSSGGVVPESMLPPFWQAMHAVWFGSGALEAIRSLAYFGGDGFAWPFVRLCIWLAALLAAAAVVPLVLRRRGGGLPPVDDRELVEGEAVAAVAAVAAA